MAAGVVEAPVFLHSVAGIAVAFDGVIPPAGAARGYFQDEIRGLAYLVDYVAVAFRDPAGIDIESDHAIRDENFGIVAGHAAHIAAPGNQHVVAARQPQVQNPSKIVDAPVLLHIRLPGGRVGQRLQVGVIGDLRAQFGRHSWTRLSTRIRRGGAASIIARPFPIWQWRYGV